jgi:S-formylglutathione hydrolase FrmB
MVGVAGDRPPPVLYLLHGLSDDDTIWLRRTSIERYVATLGLAVVMPQVHRSFYLDQAHGGRYWTYLSQELPDLVQRFLRVSDRREDTFVAGLSMGGYGALRWALRCPERFAAVASLSGALDVAALQASAAAGGSPGDPDMIVDVWDAAFGEVPAAGTDADLFHLLEAADPARTPPVFVCCGRDDGLLAHSERFAAEAARHGLAVTAQLDAGDHDWGYWDRTIQDVLAWLPLA